LYSWTDRLWVCCIKPQWCTVSFIVLFNVWNDDSTQDKDSRQTLMEVTDESTPRIMSLNDTRWQDVHMHIHVFSHPVPTCTCMHSLLSIQRTTYFIPSLSTASSTLNYYHWHTWRHTTRRGSSTIPTRQEFPIENQKRRYAGCEDLWVVWCWMSRNHVRICASWYHSCQVMTDVSPTDSRDVFLRVHTGVLFIGDAIQDI